MQNPDSFIGDVLDTVDMLSIPFCTCASAGAIQLTYGLLDGSRHGTATIVAIGIALVSSLVVSVASTVRGIQKRRQQALLDQTRVDMGVKS